MINKKILLYGEYKANTGPSNVNKFLLDNSENKFMYVKNDGSISKRVERVNKILKSDVVIFSGYGRHIKVLLILCKILHKKTVYLMHGCVEYENEINNLHINRKDLKIEQYILRNIDLVLCVSEEYMKWVNERYHQKISKLFYLNSGIDINEYKEIKKHDIRIQQENFSVAVAGGDRLQKNNLEVCKAVEMIANNISLNLNIYGRCYSDERQFLKYPHTIYKGMLSKKALYDELEKTNLFVLNSEVESFGLAVVDALMCGCDILVTQNAGICSLLDLEEADIIHDVHDVKEISDKIRNNLNKSNNKRILKSIDYKKNSWSEVAKRLYQICECLSNEEDFSHIV